jgi:hypothetical protein
LNFLLLLEPFLGAAFLAFLLLLTPFLGAAFCASSLSLALFKAPRVPLGGGAMSMSSSFAVFEAAQVPLDGGPLSMSSFVTEPEPALESENFTILPIDFWGFDGGFLRSSVVVNIVDTSNSSLRHDVVVGAWDLRRAVVELGLIARIVIVERPVRIKLTLLALGGRTFGIRRCWDGNILESESVKNHTR